MREPLFRIENLIRHNGNGFVLEIPYLVFEAGKIYSLVGPNGAGKTTLLELLNFLEKPDQGRIFFEGQEISNGSPCLSSRRQMTLIMQDPLLFHTTVFKNVAYGLKVRSVNKKTVQEKVSEALKIVGLSGFENRNAYHLSGGEAQRVAIARALALKPKILFLDELTANIDRTNTEIIERLIKEINRKNYTTIIFTTHDLSQAYRLADESISLLNGKIVDTPTENLFPGEIEEANGLKWICIYEGVKITIATEKTGKVHIAIDPEDILLSRHPLQSSARNFFFGRIIKIVAEGVLVRLTVDVGVEFTIVITKKSFEEMGLNLGSQVYLTFKTSAVHVF